MSSCRRSIMDALIIRTAWILQIFFFLLTTVSEVTSLTECFYEVGTVGGVTFLNSMFCQYGCCGTSQNQRCCTREEKYPDESKGRTWRVVALAFAGVILVLALSLVTCWILKKKNKKTVRVRTSNYSAARQLTPTRNGYVNQREIFAINMLPTTRQPQPPTYSYLPKYSETVYENGTGPTHNNGYADVSGANGGGNHDSAHTNHGGPPLQSDPQRPLSPPPSYVP